jgi:hypothetical protein
MLKWGKPENDPLQDAGKAVFWLNWWFYHPKVPGAGVRIAILFSQLQDIGEPGGNFRPGWDLTPAGIEPATVKSR